MRDSHNWTNACEIRIIRSRPSKSRELCESRNTHIRDTFMNRDSHNSRIRKPRFAYFSSAKLHVQDSHKIVGRPNYANLRWPNVGTRPRWRCTIRIACFHDPLLVAYICNVPFYANLATVPSSNYTNLEKRVQVRTQVCHAWRELKLNKFIEKNFEILMRITHTWTKNMWILQFQVQICESYNSKPCNISSNHANLEKRVQVRTQHVCQLWREGKFNQLSR